MRQARAYDNDVDFEDEVRLVVELGIDWMNARIAEWRAQDPVLPKPALIARMFNRAGERVNSVNNDNPGAVAHLQLHNPEAGSFTLGDALLSLTESHFWAEEGRWPKDLGENPERDYLSASVVQDFMVTQMQQYIAFEPLLDDDGDTVQLPSKPELQLILTDMLVLQTYMTEVVVRGDTELTDKQHVEALLLMTDIAIRLKAIEEQTIWVRNWQWGMTQIVWVYANRALRNAGTWVGQTNEVLAEGYEQFDLADEHRENFEADDYMNILIDSRCTLTGVYNFAYPDEEDTIPTPLDCCDRMVELQSLDDRFVIPDECQE
jgi:hypothetical protein